MDVVSFSNQGNSRSAAITALVSSVNECRVTVKTLVSGMKTIVWGADSCQLPGSGKWVGVPFCYHGDVLLVYKSQFHNILRKCFCQKTAKLIALLKYGRNNLYMHIFIVCVVHMYIYIYLFLIYSILMYLYNIL